MAHSGVYLSEDATKKLQEGIQAISSILSNQPTTQSHSAPEQVAGPSQFTPPVTNDGGEDCNCY